MVRTVYLAHIAEDGRTQTVLEHLTGTARRCGRFAAAFGAEEQGRLAGIAHDIGKYTAAFQKRLYGGPRVDHSTAGAAECAKRGQDCAAFCVAGHHGGLPDGGGRGSVGGSTMQGRMLRAQRGGLEDYSAWTAEAALPPAALPDFCGKDRLTDAFFIRMLYSCLVDADYLDTEAFMAGALPPQGGEPMDELVRRLDASIEKWFPPKGELNVRRCAILEQCLRQGEEQPQGLFTLTVPTGGGKTVASLAFALRHAQAHGLERVIYVIPYTSIIEQTADTFREILGPENVLEHHSGVLFDGGEDEESRAENARLRRAAENWDLPVVVTTAVQFFESLYACRPAQCRKLHNLANSVIIFDEAQMLPLPYLRPCVSAIAQLVAHYGVSAVLCTATQPALEPLFREFLPERAITELCPPDIADDPIFRRVTFQKAGRLTWEKLGEALNAHRQVLCVVNSRKAAQEAFGMLSPEGRYHLSTLMTPAHRRAVLAQVRQRLKDGLPCRVVSTSLIEAGVDVNFPAVFREEAGLDSILQAAGRCNREGKRGAAESIVTIFQREGKTPPLFEAPIAAGQTAMEMHGDLAGRETISCYFREWRDLLGSAAQDKKGLLAALQNEYFPFRTVAEQFKLIENDTRTVYIPLEEGAGLVECLRRGELSRDLFRRLGQYGVSVFDDHFRALDQAEALELLEDGSAVLRDLALYSDVTGLSLTADSGKELFI